MAGDRRRRWCLDRVGAADGERGAEVTPCKICGDPVYPESWYFEMYLEVVCSDDCLAELRDMQDADLRKEGWVEK